MKKCTAQKSLKNCLLVFSDGQKNLIFFLNFDFLGHPLKKKIFKG